MPENESFGELMTIYTDRQLAELLHCSHKTVKSLARRNKIRGFKVGDLWRFTEDDFKAYVELQKKDRRS